MKIKGKYVILQKIADNRFNGEHPNGVYVGNILEGYALEEIKIGEQLYLYPYDKPKMDNHPCAWTSKVMSYTSMGDHYITTENSTYEVVINGKI